MKKRKTLRMIMVNAFAVMLFVANGIVSLAAVGPVTVSILPNQIWSADSDNTDTRTGTGVFVYAQNYSVWPTDGTKDTFSRIKARATNGYGLVVTDIYNLDETATEATEMYLYDGYANISVVGFQFRGNTDKAAYALVFYSGR